MSEWQACQAHSRGGRTGSWVRALGSLGCLVRRARDGIQGWHPALSPGQGCCDLPEEALTPCAASGGLQCSLHVRLKLCRKSLGVEASC